MSLSPNAPFPSRDVFHVADPISSVPDLWQQEAIRGKARFEEAALVAAFVAKLVLK
jgi:hypothetical protein